MAAVNAATSRARTITHPARANRCRRASSLTARCLPDRRGAVAGNRRKRPLRADMLSLLTQLFCYTTPPAALDYADVLMSCATLWTDVGFISPLLFRPARRRHSLMA